MADTVHHASLLPAPLQTPGLTFTKSQGDRCLARLEQHTLGSGIWLDPSSHITLHLLLPRKDKVRPPSVGGNGKSGLFNRSSRCPSQTWDVDWEVSPSRKLSQDATRSRGMQVGQGNDEQRGKTATSQRDKGRSAPLSIQPFKSP